MEIQYAMLLVADLETFTGVVDAILGRALPSPT
jgi:hypothetical protein